MRGPVRPAMLTSLSGWLRVVLPAETRFINIGYSGSECWSQLTYPTDFSISYSSI